VGWCRALWAGLAGMERTRAAAGRSMGSRVFFALVAASLLGDCKAQTFNFAHLRW